MATAQQRRRPFGNGESTPGTSAPKIPRTARRDRQFGYHGDSSDEDMETDEQCPPQTTVFIAYGRDPPNELLECIRKGLEAKGVHVLHDVNPGEQTVGETARIINEGYTCLFLLTRDAVQCPFYTLQVIQAIEKAQREGKLGGIFLTHNIRDSDISDAVLLRIIPRFTLQFNENGEWRPSQVEGVLKKIRDNRPINCVLPVGNVAHAQAWSHIFGYYMPVMPALEHRIKSCPWYNMYRISRMPVRVYELIPATGDIPSKLGKKDGPIKLVGQLDEILVNKAGNKDRTYIPNVYSIEDDGQVYYCVAQYPNVLSAIDKMEKSKDIRMDKNDKRTQVKRFANTLRTVINHRSNVLCRHKIRILQFDDEKEKPSTVLLRAIKSDLENESFVTERFNPVVNISNNRSKYDAFIVCCDSDTAVANYLWDFLKGRGKKVDGCSSRCGPEYQSLRDAIEESRWVILLLSKKTLMDFSMGCKMVDILNDGVDRHDLNILLVLIDLEEQHIPYALRWIGYLENKTGYEERLLHWIEGNDVQFALDSTSLPAWNIGYTLAWGYVVNYLQTVLEYFCEHIPKALNMEKIDRNLCPQKLYLLVPDSIRCTDLVNENCKYVKHVITFGRINDIQGAAVIVKSLDIYKITDPVTKESYYMVCQFPAPILTLCNMNDSKMAGLNDQTMKEEADRFCNTLNLLMHSPVGKGLAAKYEIVRYQDSIQEGLPNEFIPRIKRDIGCLDNHPVNPVQVIYQRDSIR